MKKDELLNALVKKTGLKKKEADAFVDAFSEIVTEALVKEDSVMLPGVGTFKSVKAAERTVRNPRTGEKAISPACIKPKFVAAKALKEAVNK